MSEAERSDEGRERLRPGRWRTGTESRRRILESARAAFARQGYDRATVRQIAEDARVDPAMVHYFFGTKAKLFAEAMKLPANPADEVSELLAGGLDGIGERIILRLLTAWDSAGNVELLGLMRSAPTDEMSADMFREFLEREVVSRVAEFIADEPDARLRAELVGSQLMGIAMARYVVRVEPLASAPREDLAKWIGPTLQRYLTGSPA